MKEIEINPLMLFLPLQNPGKISHLGGKIDLPRRQGLSPCWWGPPVPPHAWQHPWANLLSAQKAKGLGEPVPEDLLENLYLADSSFELCNLPFVCQVKSAKMVCCRLIYTDLWLNLAYF